jgi:hypothetical protein
VQLRAFVKTVIGHFAFLSRDRPWPVGSSDKKIRLCRTAITECYDCCSRASGSRFVGSPIVAVEPVLPVSHGPQLLQLSRCYPFRIVTDCCSRAGAAARFALSPIVAVEPVLPVSHGPQLLQSSWCCPFRIFTDCSSRAGATRFVC